MFGPLRLRVLRLRGCLGQVLATRLRRVLVVGRRVLGRGRTRIGRLVCRVLTRVLVVVVGRSRARLEPPNTYFPVDSRKIGEEADPPPP